MKNRLLPPVLHLMCGLPGSGKTTLAKKISKQCNAVRFSPDEWLYDLGLGFYNDEARIKVEKLQWKVAQALLRAGHDVILENGFWFKSERDTYRAIADKLGATTKIYFLDISLEELKNRLIERNRESTAYTPIVNLSHLDKWADLFDPPK
jgi:predicted kinase